MYVLEGDPRRSGRAGGQQGYMQAQIDCRGDISTRLLISRWGMWMLGKEVVAGNNDDDDVFGSVHHHRIDDDADLIAS